MGRTQQADEWLRVAKEEFLTLQNPTHQLPMRHQFRFARRLRRVYSLFDIGSQIMLFSLEGM